MTKQRFFYNVTSTETNGSRRFSYGIMTAESDILDDAALSDQVFEKVESLGRENHPNAVSINITAFNRV
mgnify:CR=1 FL=1